MATDPSLRHRTLTALGVVERKFNPKQLRDPGGKGGGRWVKNPAASAVGLIDKLLAGEEALAAAGSRLPDRVPGVPDTDAQLTFTHDPGWADHVGEGTSRAVRLYRNSTYKKINGYLRDDSGDPYLDIREKPGSPPRREHILYDHVLLIDQAMEESSLAAPVQAWRGVSEGPASFGDAWDEHDMTGVEWDERAFTSTSTDQSIGRIFAGDVLLRLDVPAGVGAIRLDGWRSHDNAEAELLLQRGLRMRVVADTPGSGGYRLVGGEWVDTGPLVHRVLDVVVEPIEEEDE